MATLALSTAGAALGSSLLPQGLSLLGGTISGQALGQAAGALAGRYIDQALLGAMGPSRQVEGPRLENLQVSGSTEGTPIPRLFGRARLAGQLIWATDFEEEVNTRTSTSGSAKTGQQTSSQTSYLYYANLALGLCEGEIGRVGRIWADGQELDLSRLDYRIYKGDETQQPDSLIEAHEGAGNCPAYRGLAYIVFEHLPLAQFGNRIPQFNFEVFRQIDPSMQRVRAVNLLPGSGEFVTEPETVLREIGPGQTEAENRHTFTAQSDWAASLNDLQESVPALAKSSLLVTWFGTDLRAGQCQLLPGVDIKGKNTRPVSWSVAGQDRAAAYLVSRTDDLPSSGGTPSDASVIAAIRDLRDRGIAPIFYPFIFMDIPAGNNLPDPYGEGEQAAYPWRGRITANAANIENEVASFVGTTQVNDFAILNDEIIYSGPEEWSFRRFILHYAWLCKAAGGVDAFLIGSELKSLTSLKTEDNGFPFVDALVQLARDVRSVLGADTKISYGADWSEYFGYQPEDGSGDVWFHLDPLWASPDIDAVAIDNYWPLSDWREGGTHLDAIDGEGNARSVYDLEYLQGNIKGGEGYDWYYASPEDRDEQIRTPITDGLGKPWIYRFKDIWSWWQHQHFNRIGGEEQAVPTAWIPESKPFWFSEMGCPAVQNGANQPNVFVDPKSSESFLPYHSNGVRDDYIQRRYIEAFLRFFDAEEPTFSDAQNPGSSVYGGRMLSIEDIYLYGWDVRPFPVFPYLESVWADAPRWQTGHWLNGRMDDISVRSLLRALAAAYDMENHLDVADNVAGTLQGYVLDRPLTLRGAIQPFEAAFFVDFFESMNQIICQARQTLGSPHPIDKGDIVEPSAGRPLVEKTRKQETDLPARIKITAHDAGYDYRPVAVEAIITGRQSDRLSEAHLPFYIYNERLGEMAESWLHEMWGARDSLSFALPPSMIDFEVGDLVQLAGGSDLEGEVYRITQIQGAFAKTITASRYESAVYQTTIQSPRGDEPDQPDSVSQPLICFLDIPLPGATEEIGAGYIAGFVSPWTGPMRCLQSVEDESGYEDRALISYPATVGELLSDLPSGPISRMDYGTKLHVKIYAGQLLSASHISMLGGKNFAAVQVSEPQLSQARWEILQFEQAELVAPGEYILSHLLRGQLGSEDLIATGGSSGAAFILLDAPLVSTGLEVDQIGQDYFWRCGPASEDHLSDHYSLQNLVLTGEALKPWSPVHVEGKLSPEGLELSWIRRTRSGGDRWDLEDVPLGESYEAYEVTLSSGSVEQKIRVNQPNVHLTSEEITEHFGTYPTQIEASIVQISDAVGAGKPAHISLDLIQDPF